MLFHATDCSSLLHCRTFEASDPFIDLSLTSISQLLRERHADSRENLEPRAKRSKPRWMAVLGSYSPLS